MGHPHWVVQVPRLRCSNAYTYSHSHSHRYTYGNSYSDSHVYSDRYGDLYAYCHCDIHAYGDCDIHTYGDCNSNCNRYGNRYRYRHRHRYSDANTNTSCADGIERYQPDYQQLYCELDQCQRCDRLPVGRVYEQYLWHLPAGYHESACRQRHHSKRHRL